MKYRVVALTTLLTTIGLTVPVMAQIQRPSQDFFDQGRQQLEREIKLLQGTPIDIEETLPNRQSEPLLEVRPLPESSSSEQNEVETFRQNNSELNMNNTELQGNDTELRPSR